MTRALAERGRAAAAALPLLAVSAVVLDTGVAFLPPGEILFKLTLLRLVIIAGLIALVTEGARWRDFRTPLDLPIAVLLFVSLLATIGHDAAGLRFLITALAFFYLTVATLRRDPDARLALPVVALVAVVAAALTGVAQVAQSTPTGFYRQGLTPVTVTSLAPRPDLLPRAIGTFDNPNLLAAYVLLLAPLAAVGIARAGPVGMRAVIAGLIVLVYLGLLLTFSRSGWGAAVLAGAGVLAALQPEWRRRLVPMLAFAIALVLLGTLVTGGGLLSGVGRPSAWHTALRVSSHHPILGVGLGRAGSVMQAFSPQPSPFLHAHNLWLNWLVEAGPVALVVWIWITYVTLRDAARRAARGASLGAAVLGGLIGYYVYSLFDHPANAERIALAFWLLVACVAAARRPQAAAEPGAGSSPLGRWRHIRWGRRDDEPELADTAYR